MTDVWLVPCRATYYMAMLGLVESLSQPCTQHLLLPLPLPGDGAPLYSTQACFSHVQRLCLPLMQLILAVIHHQAAQDLVEDFLVRTWVNNNLVWKRPSYASAFAQVQPQMHLQHFDMPAEAVMRPVPIYLLQISAAHRCTSL